MDIGIIGEGVTDQITIENILFGYFNDKDLLITQLQPKPNEAGNWDKVCKYIKSDEFKQSLGFNDLIIIQIDTDFLRSGEVPTEYKVGIENLSSAEIVLAVRAKLVDLIGQEFYRNNYNKIVFAIAVDKIECWFLPIYFSNQPKKASKEIGCIETLNTVLQQKEGFYLKSKDEGFYRTISRHFHKKKNLLKYSSASPSFRMFVEDLTEKSNQEK